MPATATVYRTRDGRRVAIGDKAFNTDALKPGYIKHDEGKGWFRFLHTDGTTALLDGSRICSLQWANYRFPAYL